MDKDTGMEKALSPLVISVSSGKGGVGKTSIAVNMAFSLARGGLKCLLVDGDLGLANIDVLLGLTVRSTIRDVIAGDEEPSNVIVFPEPGLGVLPASSGVSDMVNLGPEDRGQIGEILGEISHDFDCMIIDTAAGIGPSVLWFNAFAGRSIVVLTPDPTSLTDAYALIKVLNREHGRKEFYLIPNMVKDEREGLQVYEGLGKVVKRFLKITPHHLGSIPRDAEGVKAVREQRPFLKSSPRSKAAEAIDKMSKAIASWMGHE